MAPQSEKFAAFRAGFPAFDSRRYLDLAARGILSKSTCEVMENALRDQMHGREDKKEWKRLGELARSRVAELFGVTGNEIAFTKNVSDGLNAITNAIAWKPGDNVVCALDGEHPNAVYTVLNLARRGMDVRSIPLLGGKIDLKSMLKSINGNTRLVMVSSVNFSTGIRADLAPLGEACRKNGILFLVDGAQSAGVLAIDLQGNGVDAYAASASKGLLGPYGLGFLYCNTQWANRLQPAYLSRFGISAEGYEDSDLGPDDYRLHPDARRFDVGNANYVALIGAAYSAHQLLELGIHEIERRATALSRQLADGLLDIGLNVVHDRKGENTHIVCIKGDSANDEILESFKQFLTASLISFSIRRGAVRFGLHAYNDPSDVDAVLHSAHEAFDRHERKRRRALPPDRKRPVFIRNESLV